MKIKEIISYNKFTDKGVDANSNLNFKGKKTDKYQGDKCWRQIQREDTVTHAELGWT